MDISTIKEKLKSLSVSNRGFYRDNERKKRVLRRQDDYSLQISRKATRCELSQISNSRQAIMAAIEFGDCPTRVIFDLERRQQTRDQGHRIKFINSDRRVSENEERKRSENNVDEDNFTEGYDPSCQSKRQEQENSIQPVSYQKKSRKRVHKNSEKLYVRLESELYTRNKVVAQLNSDLPDEVRNSISLSVEKAPFFKGNQDKRENLAGNRNHQNTHENEAGQRQNDLIPELLKILELLPEYGKIFKTAGLPPLVETEKYLSSLKTAVLDEIKVIKERRRRESQRIIELNKRIKQLEIKITEPDLTLHDFEIKTEEIGSGSYGKVILAATKKTGLLYALKKVKKGKEFSDISQEIAIHRKLNHPNIIELRGSFETEGANYMVLEYAEKGDLFTLLYDEKDKGNKLSNERIFKLFYQICLAVDYLHKKDIMHGDLKPGNILLDRDLNVKIADFGCATKEILQKKVRVGGTMAYLAPEVKVEESRQDYRVDLWALGVILYEMFHLEYPYGRMREKLAKQRIPKFDSSMDANAVSLIIGLLQIDANQRLSLAEIFEHPWVKEHMSRLSVCDDIVVLQASPHHHMQQASLSVVVDSNKKKKNITKDQKKETVLIKANEKKKLSHPKNKDLFLPTTTTNLYSEAAGAKRIPKNVEVPRQKINNEEGEESSIMNQKKKTCNSILNQNPTTHNITAVEDIDYEWERFAREINGGGGDFDYFSSQKKGKEMCVKISAWNINSLRTILQQTELDDYIREREPDVLFLLELRVGREALRKDKSFEKFIDKHKKIYSFHINCCQVRDGYSGLLVLTKASPISVQMGMGVEKHDLEGRVIMLEYEQFYLVGVYAPNSGGSGGLPNQQKHDYRTLEWDPEFLKFVSVLKGKKEVIIIGDLNVSHKELDVFDSVKFEGMPGFTQGERQNFTKLLVTGFVDTYRHLYSDEKKWTHWNTWASGREKGQGKRLDYALVTQNLMATIKDSLIIDQVKGSDHCPVEIHLKI